MRRTSVFWITAKLSEGLRIFNSNFLFSKFSFRFDLFWVLPHTPLSSTRRGSDFWTGRARSIASFGLPSQLGITTLAVQFSELGRRGASNNLSENKHFPFSTFNFQLVWHKPNTSPLHSSLFTLHPSLFPRPTFRYPPKPQFSFLNPNAVAARKSLSPFPPLQADFLHSTDC